MTNASALGTIDDTKDFSDAGLAALVGQLHHDGKLTGALLVHAICMGHAAFFRHALAALTGLPLPHVAAAMHDHAGVAVLWRTAGLAEALLPAVEAALDALKGCEDTKPAVLLAEVIAGPGVPVTIH